MSLTHYKICPECQARAALAAPHCLMCRRRYNTRFVPARSFQTLRLPFTAVITTPTKKDAAAVLQICGIVLFALGVLCASLARPAPEHPGFVRANEPLWSGEPLYFSAEREQTPTPAFVILGGNDRCKAPNGQTFRGVKVRYPNGAEAWKPRETILRSGGYFVKEDSALASKKWRIYAQ